MSPDATYYRTGLIEAILLLLLLLLAFGALTLIMRERWLALGATESLLARLAASAVVASVAVGGLSGVVLDLLQCSAFSDTTLSFFFSSRRRHTSYIGDWSSDVCSSD